MKQYKAIFFDWDGTAVLSRKAPVDGAVKAMRPLLDRGVKLAIISGTTYNNIAGGRLHTYFTPDQLDNLFLGLGRGAFDYGFSGGQPVILCDRIPDRDGILSIHDVCYKIHRELLKTYGLPTDITFSRPNYCKIDLMPNLERGEKLFLQKGEKELLQEVLSEHKIDGVTALIKLAESFSSSDMPIKVTSDIKYLEAGPTGKSDNVDSLFERFGLPSSDCCFWGDEFTAVADNVYGSDSGMITEKTSGADFYDVSDLPGVRPDAVQTVGGGVSSFLKFLEEQAV